MSKPYGICVVRLVLRCSAKENVQFPGLPIIRKNLCRAVLSFIPGVISPDAVFSVIVAAERDGCAKDLRVMHRDIHGSKATHRKPADSAVGRLGNCTKV